MKYRLTLFVFLLVVSGSEAKFRLLPHDSLSRWSFEYHFGTVWNARLPLTIKQAGYPDIYLAKAEFYSEPFVSPHYWDWRFTKWFKNQGVSFEAIHHKIYLRNKPPEVKRFGISHGYNMLVFSYMRNMGYFDLHLGGGSVLLYAV